MKTMTSYMLLPKANLEFTCSLQLLLMYLLLTRHGLGFRRGRNGVVRRLRWGLMAISTAPSWPTTVRLLAPGGSHTPVLSPFVKLSWPPRCLEPATSLVDPIRFSSPRPSHTNAKRYARHRRQERCRRVAPLPPHHFHLQLANSFAIFLSTSST